MDLLIIGGTTEFIGKGFQYINYIFKYFKMLNFIYKL